MLAAFADTSMIHAHSSPNIALIKYWGNRNNEWRLPAADSVSMVLDFPTVRVAIELAEKISVQSYDHDGVEKPQSDASIARLEKHYALSKEFLRTIGRDEELPENVSIVIHSGVPPAIGIASSAAVFSCLAEAYGALVKGDALSRKEISILGRLGAGSGARNSFGGYVALENHGEGIGSAYGRQIASEQDWMLHDIILVPDQKEKKVGSTEGHAKAATSPLFAKRLNEIPRRMQECISALETKDFEKLRKVSEEDALEMHRVMQTQTPSLQYLSNATHRIIRDIERLRKSDKLNVLYTMDAGPTVHLICTGDSLAAVVAFAEAQKDCIIFKAKTGGASHLS
ncbi:diphosphomevalonate decarboxylase [Candidatus Peribacteria bacterium]|nr:diphosphomevalonate decarboxylase [Candidatus Peribacteria bacterium]